MEWNWLNCGVTSDRVDRLDLHEQSAEVNVGTVHLDDVTRLEAATTFILVDDHFVLR